MRNSDMLAQRSIPREGSGCCDGPPNGTGRRGRIYKAYIPGHCQPTSRASAFRTGRAKELHEHVPCSSSPKAAEAAPAAASRAYIPGYCRPTSPSWAFRTGRAGEGVT